MTLSKGVRRRDKVMGRTPPCKSWYGWYHRDGFFEKLKPSPTHDRSIVFENVFIYDEDVKRNKRFLFE